MIKPHCLGPDHEGELAFVAPGRPGGAERGCLGECSGWGNPEPSWLRTHPATEERISLLLSLADAHHLAAQFGQRPRDRGLARAQRHRQFPRALRPARKAKSKGFGVGRHVVEWKDE